MAHGQPDYSATGQKQTTYALSDMAELAARLGSPHTYDRRGDVIWIDDFESGLLKWQSVGSGVGNAAAISSLHARNGGFSCKLTTGSTISCTARINKYIPAPVLSRVGAEFHFTRPGANWVEMYLRLNPAIAGKTWDARIKFVDATGILQCWSGGIYNNVTPNVGARANDYEFQPLKYVIDLNTDRYVRLIFADVEYDLSAWAVPTGLGGSPFDMPVEIRSEGDPTFNVVQWIDDVIITQNEP
jgi:hypothetical protein